MNENQAGIMDLINRFETTRFNLIFMEAAFRGMMESGIIEEPGISEGISGIFNVINQEQEIISKQFQKIALSSDTVVGN